MEVGIHSCYHYFIAEQTEASEAMHLAQDHTASGGTAWIYTQACQIATLYYRGLMPDLTLLRILWGSHLSLLFLALVLSSLPCFRFPRHGNGFIHTKESQQNPRCHGPTNLEPEI